MFISHHVVDGYTIMKKDKQTIKPQWGKVSEQLSGKQFTARIGKSLTLSRWCLCNHYSCHKTSSSGH